MGRAVERENTMQFTPEIGTYGIESVPEWTTGAVFCLDCGRHWLEDITPAGRCPFEYEHDDENLEIDLDGGLSAYGEQG
jgi:hypothetical protein